MNSARVAIKSVRFKSGGEVRLLRQPAVDRVRVSAEGALRRMLDASGGVTGYAIVAWDKDGGSQAAHWSGPGPTWPVPQVLIPEFVRSRLTLAIATQWAGDDAREMLGYAPAPDDAS